MKWNYNSEIDEEEREVSGNFNIFGRSYTYEENKLIFLLSGFILASIFSLVFIGVMYIIFTIITVYTGVLISIVEIVVSGLILLCFVGGIKYLITGDPRPFVKIESDDNSKRVTFMEW
jgi:hypothetical protein